MGVHCSPYVSIDYFRCREKVPHRTNELINPFLLKCDFVCDYITSVYVISILIKFINTVIVVIIVIIGKT